MRGTNLLLSLEAGNMAILVKPACLLVMNRGVCLRLIENAACLVAAMPSGLLELLKVIKQMVKNEALMLGFNTE